MRFEDFVKKENARRVAHVVRFTKAHGRQPSMDEMNDMFGYTEKQHRELLAAAKEGRPAIL
jgi:hypothetical protein